MKVEEMGVRGLLSYSPEHRKGSIAQAKGEVNYRYKQDRYNYYRSWRTIHSGRACNISTWVI